VIHYLGDSACFTHVVIPGINIFDFKHNAVNLHYRNMVSERTDLRAGFGKQNIERDINMEDLFSFFQINYDKYPLDKESDAYASAYTLSYTTCYNSFDFTKPGVHTSKFMADNYKKTLRLKWRDFNTNWQLNNKSHNAYLFLMRIQETLEYTVFNIIWFLNHVRTQINKYLEHDYYDSSKQNLEISMVKKMMSEKLGLSNEGVRALKHFYNKTKEYLSKGKNNPEVHYLEICEYITGFLSNQGDNIDLQWYDNERDMGSFTEEILGEVYAYCQDRVLDDNILVISEEEINPT